MFKFSIGDRVMKSGKRVKFACTVRMMGLTTFGDERYCVELEAVPGMLHVCSESELSPLLGELVPPCPTPPSGPPFKNEPPWLPRRGIDTPMFPPPRSSSD